MVLSDHSARTLTGIPRARRCSYRRDTSGGSPPGDVRWPAAAGGNPPPADVAETVGHHVGRGGIVLDLSSDGRLLGMEVIGARQLLGTGALPTADGL
ncbi:hypothetical protein Axi01nite_67080 [Actinoplanes xinjiangensis]|nr:hypothetical protein Axi01nite_67080 [Actinoplanes xinjiangensis]